MTLENWMTTFRPRIELELRQVIETSFNGQYPELQKMLTYHMGWEGVGAGAGAGGKRIRPQMLLLCCEACGGAWEQAIPAAVSVELLHNFSLIHDDIEDNSPARHGRPTVWHQWGLAQAINAGDLMFTQANQSLLGLRRWHSAEVVLEAVDILYQTSVRLTQGQYLDMANEQVKSMSLEDYWAMVSGKTASLLAACCELGALTSACHPQQRSAMREFGLALGLAYQAQDDELGIWGDASLTGKSTESDLVSGKKTLPVVFALSQAGRFAERWLTGPVRPEEVPELANLLIEEGAQAFTHQQVEQLTQRALAALRSACSLETDAGAALLELTQLLMRRKH